MGLAGVVRDLGGFATTRQLKAVGATERMLTAAVRTGIVRRVRQGWYSIEPPSDPRFRAIRVGGRLTGLSAIEAWGGWVWMRPSLLQVAVPPNAARLRRAAGVRIHHDARPGSGDATAVALHDALVRVLIDEPPDVAIACADWALASGRADRIDVEACGLELPDSRRPILELVDGSSQSVLESVARVRLRMAGFRVQSQQPTGLLGATDLVIEGHVALELDGRAFHADSFESDRQRDLVTTREGRHVIRVSAGMLRSAWPEIEGAIRAALAARRAGNSGKSFRIPTARQRTHGRAWRVS